VATKEVTVAQFRRFLDENPDLRDDPNREFRANYSPEPDGPIVDVTWYEAARYCNWLSRREGLAREQWCYADDGKPKADGLRRPGYRLPTEDEWEYAGRAGAATSRPFGFPEALLGEYAWYNKNTDGVRTYPVGQLKPNDFGLFDSLGNVIEWCHDPLRVAGGTEDLRALRGGAFTNRASYLRCAQRFDQGPGDRHFNIGFRVARTVPDPDKP
jgi:formylglycine-generating enzyme required for sulfatase activity